MSTEHPTIDDPGHAIETPGIRTHADREHLTVVPLVGAAAAIAAGEPWAWPAAASLLAVAYLAAFLQLRREA